jgi:hypothetical protein
MTSGTVICFRVAVNQEINDRRQFLEEMRSLQGLDLVRTETVKG